MHSASTNASPQTYLGLTCPQCGYDVRGLPKPVCPECGSKFDPSAQKTPNVLRGTCIAIAASFYSVYHVIWCMQLAYSFARQYSSRCGTGRVIILFQFEIIVTVLMLAVFVPAMLLTRSAQYGFRVTRCAATVAGTVWLFCCLTFYDLLPYFT